MLADTNRELLISCIHNHNRKLLISDMTKQSGFANFSNGKLTNLNLSRLADINSVSDQEIKFLSRFKTVNAVAVRLLLSNKF